MNTIRETNNKTIEIMKLERVHVDLADIRCPYCGCGYDVFGDTRDLETKYSCPNCVKELTIIQEIHYTYKYK